MEKWDAVQVVYITFLLFILSQGSENTVDAYVNDVPIEALGWIIIIIIIIPVYDSV
jgi:hypothetical protein